LPPILAAIDESYDCEYMSIIIGDRQSIINNERKLPSNFTHMTAIQSREAKLNIIKSFNFDTHVLVACVKYGMPQLWKRIDSIQTSRKRRKPKNIISSSLSYEFRHSLESICHGFLISEGITLQDLAIEVDNSIIRDYLHRTNCNPVPPNRTHKIADCIAYTNGKHWRIDKEIYEYGTSFTRDFHNRVLNRVFR
jgi:hypothetical protein